MNRPLRWFDQGTSAALSNSNYWAARAMCEVEAQIPSADRIILGTSITRALDDAIEALRDRGVVVSAGRMKIASDEHLAELTFIPPHLERRLQVITRFGGRGEMDLSD